MSRFWQMPFNCDRWRSSDAHLAMTLEERGMYLELLMWQWMKGQLPDDPRMIAKICGVSIEDVDRLWSLTGSRVKSKFNLIPGRGWVNSEMEEERGRKQRASQKRAESGRLGGIAKSRKRKEMLANATSLPDVCYSKSLARASLVVSSSSGSSENHEEREGNSPRARENGHDPIGETFQLVQQEHPKGCNPRPDRACQLWLSRFETAEAARECLKQHREKWQPAWRAGRLVKDLDNWIEAYHPAADVAPREGQKQRYIPRSERVKGVS